jgi:2-amino-4-hydroxy-6-hydroxymethyldihydropteridine diphosphokinase
MESVYVGIGSNVNREVSVGGGIQALRARFGEVWCSSVYECAPVGFEGEPFYNLVAGFRTADSGAEVAQALRHIEAQFGRERSANKHISRTLDIDLLLYGAMTSETLRVPRADIEQYAFVLAPLAELAGDTLHPRTGQSFARMWDSFDAAAQPFVCLPEAEGQRLTGSDS